MVVGGRGAVRQRRWKRRRAYSGGMVMQTMGRKGKERRREREEKKREKRKRRKEGRKKRLERVAGCIA